MKNTIYPSISSLKSVHLIIKEAGIALGNQKQSTFSTEMNEALGALGGVGLGGAIGAGWLLLGGKAGLAGGAAIVSALAGAGALIGGGMALGVGVVAAPAVAGGVGAYALLSRRNKKRLIQEKEMLFQEALKKHNSIISELQERESLQEERFEYLKKLEVLLQGVMENLEGDLSHES